MYGSARRYCGGFSMDDVELSENHLIGEQNKGFYYAMEGFSAARVLIGATCIGASEAALELGIEHIKTRKAFVNAPKSIQELYEVLCVSLHFVYIHGKWQAG